MHKSLLVVPGIGLLVGLAALAQSLPDRGTQESDPDAQSPDSSSAPLSVRPASLMLTIGIDARGVEVLQATRKPQVNFRLPKQWETMPFRWIMRDAAGKQMSEGGFDPSEMCLDPAHYGQPPHAPGDFIVPHATHTNIKVPDHGTRFATLEFFVKDGQGYRSFSSVRRENIAVVR